MDWNALTLFLMITGRMTGMIVFNPLLGRRGGPGLVKGGLALLLSISVYAITPSGPEMPATVLGLALTFLMELFLGYVLGLVVNIFFYIPSWRVPLSICRWACLWRPPTIRPRASR